MLFSVMAAHNVIIVEQHAKRKDIGLLTYVHFNYYYAMLGFEVCFDGEVIRTSVDKGLMEVIFTSGGLDDVEFLHIWGLTSFHRMAWHSAVVEKDKVAVRIVDVSSNSELIEKEDRFKDDAEALQRYYELKQELEKEGLL
jgi:hypothetical protein